MDMHALFLMALFNSGEEILHADHGVTDDELAPRAGKRLGEAAGTADLDFRRRSGRNGTRPPPVAGRMAGQLASAS